jgi:hypothetical protein
MAAYGLTVPFRGISDQLCKEKNDEEAQYMPAFAGGDCLPLAVFCTGSGQNEGYPVRFFEN